MEPFHEAFIGGRGDFFKQVDPIIHAFHGELLAGADAIRFPKLSGYDDLPFGGDDSDHVVGCRLTSAPSTGVRADEHTIYSVHARGLRWGDEHRD